MNAGFDAVDRLLLRVLEDYGIRLLCGATMLSQVVNKLVAVLLTIVCPSAILMAERPTAMLQATGTVLLNGTPTPRSMSVFTGDRIDTADAAVGSISRTGFSLVVDPSSSIQYQDDGFAILKGTARIRTSRTMTARAGSVSVIPIGTTALFDITIDGNTALVASREGALTLTNGAETASLQPGYMAKINLDVSQDQDQGPKPAATTKGEPKNKKKLIIWIVVAAAAAAAIACGIACSEGGATPVSPVTP